MLLNEPTVVPIRKGPPRPQDAITTIPASASCFEMTSEDEIGDTLTLLAVQGDAISMYASGSRDVVLGRILSVDPELPHFVMELNEGMALPPGKITFVAVLRNAKFQFRLADPEWKTVPGKPHLVPMTFPETCSILNRRAAERVETPLGVNFTAALVVNGTPHEMSIHDFSLGGIGMRCAKAEGKGLLKGRKVVDVCLELGQARSVIVALEVRATRSFRSFLCGEQLHIGCMFINMTPEIEEEIKELKNQLIAAHRQR